MMPGVYRVQVRSGVDPELAKVGDSLKLYGEARCRVPAAGGVVDLKFESEPQSY